MEENEEYGKWARESTTEILRQNGNILRQNEQLLQVLNNPMIRYEPDPKAFEDLINAR